MHRYYIHIYKSYTSLHKQKSFKVISQTKSYFANSTFSVNRWCEIIRCGEIVEIRLESVCRNRAVQILGHRKWNIERVYLHVAFSFTYRAHSNTTEQVKTICAVWNEGTWDIDKNSYKVTCYQLYCYIFN